MQNTNNTVNLLNPGNVNPNAKSGTRSNAHALPDISFTQVLSREIAERPKAPIVTPAAPTPAAPKQNTSNSNGANSANSSNNNTKASNTNNSTNTNNSANNSTNNSNNVNQSADSSSAPAPAEKPASASKTDDSSGKDAASSTDATDNAAANEVQAASQIDPTAALLALVASVSNSAPSNTASSTSAAAAAVADSKTTGAERVDSRPTAKASSTSDPTSLTSATASDSGVGNLSTTNPVLDKGSASDADTGKGKGSAPEPKLASIQADSTNNGGKAAASATPTETFATVQAAATAQRAAPGESLSSSKEGPATPIVAAKTVSNVETTPSLAKLQQTIAPRVGNPGWDQALGQRVVYMAGSGQQTASLTLNPPELGPLQVVLTISNDQTNASFTSAQPEVRQALEAALPKLREMMSEAGIQLGNATVGTSLPNQQQSSTPGEQSRSNQQSGRFDAPNSDSDLKPVKTTVIRDALGVVDTFA